MKALLKKLLLLVVFSQLSYAFAQNTTAAENADATSSLPADIEQEQSETGSTLPPFFTAFTNSKFTFDEGASYCQLTRIEVQEKTSNFVRENMMAGAYFTVQTVDLSFFDLMASVSAYYPFYQAFNGMKQKPRNLFNFALDGFFGTIVTYNRLNYVSLNFALGMHYMYQLTDEYYMHYIGLGLITGVDFPITRNWTLVETNLVSYDNPNLGSNKKIQPFDAAYQFHINLGIKFSRQIENTYSYINVNKDK